MAALRSDWGSTAMWGRGSIWTRSGEFTSPYGGVKPPLPQLDPLPQAGWAYIPVRRIKKPAIPLQTTSAIVPSILWKKNIPPTTSIRTTRDEMPSSNVGGWPWPVKLQRNPSMTPAMGFSP